MSKRKGAKPKTLRPEVHAAATALGQKMATMRPSKKLCPERLTIVAMSGPPGGIGVDVRITVGCQWPPGKPGTVGETEHVFRWDTPETSGTILWRRKGGPLKSFGNPTAGVYEPETEGEKELKNDGRRRDRNATATVEPDQPRAQAEPAEVPVKGGRAEGDGEVRQAGRGTAQPSDRRHPVQDG